MTFHLTDKQNDANRLLGSDAGHVMLRGGSRSGKTFLICRAIATRALKAPGSRHVITRFRFNAVKQSIWHDTFPKMMKLCYPGVAFKENKQDWFWELPGGAQIWLGGLDDKERTEKILGLEFATAFLNECSQISWQARELMRTRVAQTIKTTLPGAPMLKPRMYYDCNPPRVTHWIYRLFISKVSPEPPYTALPDPDNYASMLINPIDNRENLPPEYLDELQKLSPRQRLRFWEGQFGSANENALWTPEMLERNRVAKAPERLVRIVVAVDPSGTKGEEDERSDQVGIVVAGVGADGHGYVLEDLTCRAPPAVWGRIAVTAYQRHMANAVVGETNFGGAMVSHVIQTAAAEQKVVVPYVEVTASRGKVVRAEPVATLYDQGKVHHVGLFAELEDQLNDFTTGGYMGDRSPDRADAAIWALSELFPGLVRQAQKSQDTAPIAVDDPLHEF